jgi:hypothetical protein
MGRHKASYTLKDIERKTGISYPTLILYAKEFADQIPTEGEGRTRRYPAEAVPVFLRIFAKRRPGRKPGAAWAKKPKAAQSEPGGSVPGPSSAMPQEGATPAPGLLRLAEEDRELMRNLTEALRDVAAKLQAFAEEAIRPSSE